MKRKICVVTGTRAEYGLLYWLIKEIKNDPKLQLQLIVTGMHLSYEFGFTYKEIEKDGFRIDAKVEMLLSNDNHVSITKSIGLGIIGFADALNNLKSNIVVLLGDRFEILAAAQAAMIAKIPIAHINGGETTEGVFDESIRHSITKMSHLHFTATEKYRNRVIQLGEQPNRVFNVGGLSVDNIKKFKLLNKDEFEKSINFRLNKKNILVTFHPVTLENFTSSRQFSSLLSVIDGLKNTNIIFTKANSDTNGRVINLMIDKYVNKSSYKSICFASLGKLRYLSALQFMDATVGNSSSGLTETSAFKIGAINIGDRQKGRIKTSNVIDCKPDKLSIKKAFKKLYSCEFNNILKNTQSPYGNGGASVKIKNFIKKIKLDNILKKEFYNL